MSGEFAIINLMDLIFGNNLPNRARGVAELLMFSDANDDEKTYLLGIIFDRFPDGISDELMLELSSGVSL